jgi:putative restriction endonuclease
MPAMPERIYSDKLHIDMPFGEALERLDGGTIHVPSRVRDQPDLDRFALRFERFKAVA